MSSKSCAAWIILVTAISVAAGAASCSSPSTAGGGADAAASDGAPADQSSTVDSPIESATGDGGEGGPSGEDATSTPSDGSADVGPDAASDAGSDATGDADADAPAGPPPSSGCQTPASGVTHCGASGESCCTSLSVPGATFYQDYDSPGLAPPPVDGGPAWDGAATNLSRPTTVSAFRLDKYEVTVGRFRQFVGAWNNGSGYVPAAGSGKHTHVNGGLGLRVADGDGGSSFEPGWLDSDDLKVAPTDANLACDASKATWTPSPATHESLPINCVSWWEAQAFCIWDGGFLPSEAEWIDAAAGGPAQLDFPWGTASAGRMSQYAIYNCYYQRAVPGSCSVDGVAPVGTPTLGAGPYGQLDLLGSVWEWTAGRTYTSPCTDCASISMTSQKGGGFDDQLVTAGSTLGRGYFSDRFYAFGFRCARVP